MRAVLWDMDGTLIESEKLWDISMGELCRKLGGEMTPELRTALVGGAADATMRMIFTALELEPDPVRMASETIGCTSTPASCSRPVSSGAMAPRRCWGSLPRSRCRWPW